MTSPYVTLALVSDRPRDAAGVLLMTPRLASDVVVFVDSDKISWSDARVYLGDEQWYNLLKISFSSYCVRNGI